MDNISLDSANARIHDDHNRAAIKNSLQKLGTGRSVLIDSNNILIAGNGVYEQANALGIPVKIIESDGKELIAIKRTDLNSDDDKRKALALADNKTSDLSVFSDNQVADLLATMESFSDATGFSEQEIEDLLNEENILDDLVENNFNNLIKSDSDYFAVTFVFPKIHKDKIDAVIKAKSKTFLVDKIIEICNAEEE